MTKRDYKNFIIEAAQTLIRKSDEIVNDLDSENVNHIYISLTLTNNEVPQLDIQKTYTPVPRGW